MSQEARVVVLYVEARDMGSCLGVGYDVVASSIAGVSVGAEAGTF